MDSFRASAITGLILCCSIFNVAWAQQENKALDSLNKAMLTMPVSAIPAHMDAMYYRIVDLPMKDAVDAANNTIDFSKKHNLTLPLIWGYLNLANIYNKNDLATDAYQWFQKAISVALEANDHVGLMRAYLQTGQFQVSSYLYDESLKSYLMAGKLAEMDHDTLNYCRSLEGVMDIYLTTSNFKKAEESGKQFIFLYKRLNKDDRLKDGAKSIMHMYNSLAIAFNDLKQYDSAILYFEYSEQIAREIKDEFWTVLSMGNKGASLFKLGRYADALPFLKFDAVNSQKFKQWGSAINSMVAITDLYLAIGNIPMASIYLDSGRLLSDKYVKGELPVDYWRSRADLEYELGHYKLSREAQTRYTREWMAATQKKGALNVAKVQAAFDLERKQNEIELLTQDNDLQTVRLANQKILFIGLLSILVLVAAGAVNFIYNYRKQKKITEMMRTAQEQLIHSEKMSSLGQLTAGLAHEINNPINFIQSGAEALQDNMKLLIEVLDEYEKSDTTSLSEQQKRIRALKEKIQYESVVTDIQELIKAIGNGARRSAGIIAGLQRFSRKGGEQISTVSIASLIDETLVLIQGELRTVTIEKQYDLQVSVECNVIEIGQVFMNVLVNAAQAIKGSGKIIITTAQVGENAVISIRDDGVGMSPEVLSKIFNPFYTTKDVGKGTGLGLSITHGIVERHRGEISVKSTPGQGTEFTIVLPLR